MEFRAHVQETSRKISGIFLNISLFFPEISWTCPGQKSQTPPEIFPDMSWTFPENSWIFPGKFLDMFRKRYGMCPVNVPEKEPRKNPEKFRKSFGTGSVQECSGRDSDFRPEMFRICSGFVPRICQYLCWKTS